MKNENKTNVMLRLLVILALLMPLGVLFLLPGFKAGCGFGSRF